MNGGSCELALGIPWLLAVGLTCFLFVFAELGVDLYLLLQ